MDRARRSLTAIDPEIKQPANRVHMYPDRPTGDEFEVGRRSGSKNEQTQSAEGVLPSLPAVQEVSAKASSDVSLKKEPKLFSVIS
jgi:hypothetical protein